MRIKFEKHLSFLGVRSDLRTKERNNPKPDFKERVFRKKVYLLLINSLFQGGTHFCRIEKYSFQQPEAYRYLP